jgi:hypothetical protein
LNKKRVFVSDSQRVTGLLIGTKKDYEIAERISKNVGIEIEKFLEISLHFGVGMIDEILSVGDNMERFKKEFEI